MNLWKKIVDIAGGSLVDTLVGAAKEYFPPSMTDQEKSKLELAMQKVAHKQELAMIQATNHMEAEFNQRIKDMEGTAKDLLALPYVGRFIIFMRGTLRPVWCACTMVLMFMIYSGQWQIIEGSQVATVFLINNIIVVVFLFGERAFKNVSPLIERLLKK